MANIASAKKRIRTTATRTEINTRRRSRVRTFVRKVEEAIAAGNKEVAREALRVAESELARAVKTGVFKSNTVSRKVSRLSAKVKAIA